MHIQPSGVAVAYAHAVIWIKITILRAKIDACLNLSRAQLPRRKYDAPQLIAH